jgi:Secretion system C-terminal sorting domain
MRKFLLILLNVLCLAGAFGQTRVITSGRSYNQKNATDTIKLDYEIKYFNDSKTCLDTAYRTVFHDYYDDNTTKLIENGQYKFDKQGRILEYTTIDSTYTRLLKTDPFVYESYQIIKKSNVYTSATTRADTIYTFQLDTETKQWVRINTSYMRKPGVGNDTFRTTTKTIVYDPNANIILDLTRNSLGKTTDSTVNVYINKNISKQEKYIALNSGVLRTDITNYGYTNNKLVLEQRIAYSGTVAIDTNTHTYAYKAEVLDSEEYEIKSWDYNSQTRVKTITNYQKRKVTYQYDRLNNRSGRMEYTWDLVKKSWIFGKSLVKEFSQDSLNSKSVTTTYLNDIPVNIYTQNSTFINCSPVVSDIKDIEKGIDFTLSPNPTTGLFNLLLSNEAIQSGASISVYNIQGVEVFRTKLTSESTAIDLSNLSKGFYLVKVADKTHFTVKKMVLN